MSLDHLIHQLPYVEIIRNDQKIHICVPVPPFIALPLPMIDFQYSESFGNIPVNNKLLMSISLERAEDTLSCVDSNRTVSPAFNPLLSNKSN